MICNFFFTLSQATKALRESTGTALLYFRTLHQKGVRGQRHAPAAPYPRERPGTHCTGGWVGLRAGLDWRGKSRPTGIRSLDRPARRQSLYRLRYPAHVLYILIFQFLYSKLARSLREVSSGLCAQDCGILPATGFSYSVGAIRRQTRRGQYVDKVIVVTLNLAPHLCLSVPAQLFTYKYRGR